MKRVVPFAYTVSAAGFVTMALCMAAGVRWWGFAMCVAEAVAGLAWWSAGRRRPAQVRPRPDYARIAVLEHELLGIAPEPGTAAAASVALRARWVSVNQAHGRELDHHTLRRPCPHEQGQWIWSEQLGRLWRCTECPKTMFQ